MNAFNALGFLALGSVMNALPALVPTLVARGGVVFADVTASALWLHFMGLVMGLLGGGWMLREVFAHVSIARTAAAHARAAAPVSLPERSSNPVALPEVARAA